MVTCYIGIGSNVGNRQGNIKTAIELIKALKDTQVLKVSGIIETFPVGGPKGQGKFLNGAIKIRTNLSALKLLSSLKNIEGSLGRKKTVRNGPRTIDLDILLYGNKFINSRKLNIPHRKMFERDFVLRPLLEII